MKKIGCSRLLRIRELNIDEIQFLVFLQDRETFPRKIVPKIYEYAKKYNYDKIAVKRKPCNLSVVFDSVNLYNPHRSVVIGLRIDNGKIHHVNFSGTEVHPNVEALLDALSFVQTMTTNIYEKEKLEDFLSNLKYDTIFCVNMVVHGSVASLSIVIGNLYVEFQSTKSYLFNSRLGVFYMGQILLCKMY